MFKSPTTPQKPTISVRDIPSIGDLCELLGFKRVTDKDTEEFMEITREYMQSYDFLDGMDLEKLLEWNMPTIHMELKEMATKFLSDPECQYGDRFWNGKRSWYPGGLRYPENEDRIICLLMQLFWRQNTLAFGRTDRDIAAKHTSRDHLDEASEDSQPQRLMSRSITMRRESPDLQVNIHDGKAKSRTRPLPASGSHTINNAHALDIPDDMGTDIRDAMDFLSKDDQMVAQILPEITPSGSNTRKRKAPGSEPPRRSGRKPKEPQRPEFVSPDKIEDLDSNESSDEFLEQSIERDEDVDAELSREMEHLSNTSTNQNMDSYMVGVSPSERRLHKAPVAPMSTSAKKTKKSLLNKRTRASFSSTSRSSAKSKTNSTIQGPLVGHKVTKLNMPSKMPSIKAQSKPLTDKLPANVQSRTPLIRDENNATDDLLTFSGGGGSSPNRSQPPNPTIEPSQPPPLPPAAQVMTTPTSLPLPPAADIASGSMSTPPSSLTAVQIWVVTYSPKRTEEWLHGVQLAGTSLPSFLTNIADLSERSVDEIGKMKLSLEMPTLNTKVTVCRGQDAIWERTKETFAERLSLQRGEQSLERCKIFVEPVWVDGKAEVDDGEGEDGLYDF
ncbi:hypothetical protein BKA64DRAFT_745836 [Cadophora sp. MPI-SDFR-AT-0126]|nr:hypothetical protein BKA64DRAFT_745836 [Leotiomycetes sp. MPI-SDFR-AT-0126]